MNCIYTNCDILYSRKSYICNMGFTYRGQNNAYRENLQSGPPREILQGGTRLLWNPGDRLKLFSKLRIWVENTNKNKKNENIKIKRQWRQQCGPSEIHEPLLGSPGPEPMYRVNPPLIYPAYNDNYVGKTSTYNSIRLVVCIW